MNTVSKKGSSLLEVLIALALLGSTMASLLSLYVASERFYDRLFPMDLFSVRDCIENSDSPSSTLFLSYSDESGWVSSNVSGSNACCVVEFERDSSGSLGDYEIVSVFSFNPSSDEASNYTILTYFR